MELRECRNMQRRNDGTLAGAVAVNLDPLGNTASDQTLYDSPTPHCQMCAWSTLLAQHHATL